MKYSLLAILVLLVLVGCQSPARQAACAEGYLLDGTVCCLDQNKDGICDDKQTVKPSEPTAPIQKEIAVNEPVQKTTCTDECNTDELTCKGQAFVACKDTNGDGCKELVPFQECGAGWSCSDVKNCVDFSKSHLMISDTLETVASTIGSYPQYVAKGDKYKVFRLGGTYACSITRFDKAEKTKIISFCTLELN